MKETSKEISKEISKEVIRKTEKEKRGGYLLLDIGGTEIKGCVSDAEGEKTRIRKFPSQAQKSAEKILDNFSRICRELLKDIDGSVCGVGMAIPGPFDYQKGISRMQGLNKYDSIYGIPLEPEIKARVPELKEAQFLFLHDIEAFALGESWYGTCRGEEKILCVCIGTGAGSAFVEHRKTIKTGTGVPENGWIYRMPFRESILDDYLSARGLERISLAVMGKAQSGRELSNLAEAGNMEAREVWRRFGADVAEGLLPVLTAYRPDLLLLGGQISKSFRWFGAQLNAVCGKRGISIQIEPETSARAMDGLLSQLRVPEPGTSRVAEQPKTEEEG